jgi:hypothetical protein
MTIEARKMYLKAIQDRYQKASKSEKTLILDEFCQVCQYSRKHAIRVIKTGHIRERRRTGKPSKYQDAHFVAHVLKLWEATGFICSKRLVAAIPLWLPYYGLLDVETNTKLKSVSSSTVERILKKNRSTFKGLSSTVPTSLPKSQIPLELLDKDITGPGFVEADTVVHCGNSLAGEYACTLTVTDIYSAWTENRATWMKSASVIVSEIADVEKCLPFALHGFATDNGSEFLNQKLINYFKENRKNKVKFVRRRPYKKNDNAHVEQKNWTHVRQLFGYTRIDQANLIEMMNEIYSSYWNPLWNFFLPTMKLKRKTRLGGKVVKEYEALKTPYERVMNNPDVAESYKRELKFRYERLNPFELKRELEIRLKEFKKMSEKPLSLAA